MASDHKPRETFWGPRIETEPIGKGYAKEQARIRAEKAAKLAELPPEPVKPGALKKPQRGE